MTPVGCRRPEGETPEQKRTHIRAESSDILKAVYAENPKARQQVDGSAGYATFSTIETKTMFIGSGNGYRMSVDRRSGKKTYMNIRKLHVGVGAGIQEFQILMVFEDPKIFADFVAGGWQFGGGADAAAKTRESEGVEQDLQLSAMTDPMVYQVTEAGIIISATVEGFKISPDEELN